MMLLCQQIMVTLIWQRPSLHFVCDPGNCLWLHKVARYIRSTLLRLMYNLKLYGLGCTQSSMIVQGTL